MPRRLPLCRLIFLLAALLISTAPLHAQGSFPPPSGPNTPVMKTLTQVEPRTAIPAGGPYTISTPGSYYLTGNMTTTGSTTVLTIAASDVSLDLNGFTISGLNNPAAYDYGIYIQSQSNIRIFNGTIKLAARGIFLHGPNTSIRIEGVTCTQCFQTGIYADAEMPGLVISRCCIDNIGGATIANSSAYGITLYAGAVVQDCTINNVKGTGSGKSVGLDLLTGSAAIHNTIVKCENGIQFGKCRDNTTVGCTTPYFSTTDAGGNN